MTPALYRRVLLFVAGQKDLRISSVLKHDNPGILHVRKIYLESEKVIIVKPHMPTDDSSNEENTPEIENNNAINRQT